MQRIEALKSLNTVLYRIQNSKALLKDTLGAYCEEDVYVLRIQLGEDVVEALDYLGYLEFLISSAYECLALTSNKRIGQPQTVLHSLSRRLYQMYK